MTVEINANSIVRFIAKMGTSELPEYQPKFLFNKGDLIPDFEFMIQDGSRHKLSDASADWIVLFFYPKDNTPTCTKEACNLRDHFGELKKHSCVIYGVSPDDQKDHNKFMTKYSLPYDLIVDEDHKLATKFGVWGRKKFMGKVYDGIHRASFVITKGLILHDIIYPVKSDIHNEQILASILK